MVVRSGEKALSPDVKLVAEAGLSLPLWSDAPVRQG